VITSYSQTKTPNYFEGYIIALPQKRCITGVRVDGTDGFGGIVFPPFNAVRMDAQILHGTANLGEGLLLLQTHQRAAILEESRLNASASAWMVITLLSRASEMILLPCDLMR